MATGYELQTTWFEPILCSTLQGALEARDDYPYSRIVKHGHFSLDADDDGLSEDEKLCVEMPGCPARDALAALIDSRAANAAA
jgi:hypothetical protein